MSSDTTTTANAMPVELAELEQTPLEQLAGAAALLDPATATTEPPPAEPAMSAEEKAMLEMEAELVKLPPFQQAARRFQLVFVMLFSGNFEASLAILPAEYQTPEALQTLKAHLLELSAMALFHAISVNLQPEGFGIDRLQTLLIEASTTPAEALEERYTPLFDAIRKLAQARQTAAAAAATPPTETPPTETPPAPPSAT